jgi:hypothetical protein
MNLSDPSAILKRIQDLQSQVPNAEQHVFKTVVLPLSEKVIDSMNEIAILKVEISRLKGIISKAKAESELITLNDKPMIAIPYWFIKES